MGLSIVVSGAIVSIALVFGLFSMADLMESMFALEEESSAISVVEDSISKTEMKINSANASSGSAIVTFSLLNDGLEKLWNYDEFELFITYDADTGGPAPTKLTEQFSFSTIRGSPPDSDITLNGWDDSTAGCASNDNDGAIFDEMDEATSDDDTTCARSPNNPDGASDTPEVGLSNVADPVTSTGHEIKFTARKLGGTRTHTIDLQLYQGAALIASTGPNTITTSWQQFTYVLSVPEADSITDYNDLRFRFEPTTSGGGAGSRLIVSWAQLELPSSVLPNQWGIKTISNDILDPQILNSQESAQIIATLANPIFSNGLLSIVISSDNGIIASHSQLIP